MNDGTRLRLVPCLIGVLVGCAVAVATPTAARAQSSEDPDATESTDGESRRLADRSDAPFRIALGLLSGLRHMTFEGDAREVRHAPHPYVGGIIQLAGTLWNDAKLKASLDYDFEVGYGAGKNKKFDTDENRTPVTELSFGRGRIFINRLLGSEYQLGVGGGIRATGVATQPNPVYTGHRYIAADATIRLRWFGLAEDLEFAAELGVAPVFALDNSDAGHGEGQAFGGGTGLQLRWSPAAEASDPEVRNLRLLFEYRYQHFHSEFPDSFLGTDGATSADNHHVATVMVEYLVGN